MKIAIGADHAGYALKEELRKALEEKGLEVVDVGTDSLESTDYPDYAGAVAHKVADGSVARGVLVCYTGVGMSIAANKVPGVRAALAFDEDEVRLTRAHNDANVLTLGAKYTDLEKSMRLIEVFLGTEFEGGRHGRRVGKIQALEQENRG